MSATVCALVFGFLVAPSAAISRNDDVIDLWQKSLQRQCPDYHVDWLGDGLYDDVLGDFERSLSRDERRKVNALAAPNPCVGMEGFTCEMADSLYVYQRVGLTKRFIAFGCRHYRCEDIALCRRVGLPRSKYW